MPVSIEQEHWEPTAIKWKTVVTGIEDVASFSHYKDGVFYKVMVVSVRGAGHTDIIETPEDNLLSMRVQENGGLKLDVKDKTAVRSVAQLGETGRFRFDSADTACCIYPIDMTMGKPAYIMNVKLGPEEKSLRLRISHEKAR